MANKRLIHRPPISPSTEITGERVREIPEDLLREASNRLAIISLIGVVLWLIGWAADHIVMRALDPSDPAWRQLHFRDAIAAVGLLTSLGLYLYSRKPGRDPRRMLDLGLLYLIFTALDIALIWHWDAGARSTSLQPTFSWSGTLVLMFAAILPNPPWKTLVAGLIAASTNPAGMLIARAAGSWDFGPTSSVFLMHYPDYIMVGVSVVISVVVTRLGQHVSRAREMGSYQVGELLGRGGMGEVYHATHRMLARPAAIKLIRPEMIGGGNQDAEQLALKRFRREAEVAANLRSPHTVELYDFGVTEDETVYYVMELLEGMDLEALVHDHGPQPANRVIFILLQICESLEEAHGRGLVHRDIKPANIHIGRQGVRHDFVKVLDFGLVKAAAGGGTEQSFETGVEATPGTPAYMAPEMALGEAVDARADLYAVGCVGYFLLTGTVVFEATSPLQAVARHVSDPPTPPSERAGVSVPPDLELIILALLAKKPSDRPPSAAALARMLRSVKLEPWTEEQAAEWWDRFTAQQRSTVA
jgi:tRNA A-37 threonylcarbamoyl transferase component Bud32